MSRLHNLSNRLKLLHFHKEMIYNLIFAVIATTYWCEDVAEDISLKQWRHTFPEWSKRFAHGYVQETGHRRKSINDSLRHVPPELFSAITVGKHQRSCGEVRNHEFATRLPMLSRFTQSLGPLCCKSGWYIDSNHSCSDRVIDVCKHNVYNASWSLHLTPSQGRCKKIAAGTK